MAEKEKSKSREANEKKAKVVATAKVASRGRSFEGIVIKKFAKRVVIELERTIYVPKYERYQRKRSKLHARIPEDMEVSVGDLIRIQECRPLSKIIHFVIVKILKKTGETK